MRKQELNEILKGMSNYQIIEKYFVVFRYSGQKSPDQKSTIDPEVMKQLAYDFADWTGYPPKLAVKLDQEKNIIVPYENRFRR